MTGVSGIGAYAHAYMAVTGMSSPAMSEAMSAKAMSAKAMHAKNMQEKADMSGMDDCMECDDCENMDTQMMGCDLICQLGCATANTVGAFSSHLDTIFTRLAFAHYPLGDMSVSSSFPVNDPPPPRI